MSLSYDVVYRLALKLLRRLNEFDGAVLIAFRSDGNVEVHEVGKTPASDPSTREAVGTVQLVRTGSIWQCPECAKRATDKPL